jgi:HEAT repeat protein
MPGAQADSPDDLIRGLDDLKRGPEVQLLLISLGEAAIASLARYLLGPPSLHAQPRMLAAEALGAIGGPSAVRALAAALVVGDLAALPLPLRLSEEAVRNCSARELGRLGDRSAVDALLQALRRFHLVEAGAALARFRDARAIPPLVDCLDDPFIRERAAVTLLEFGQDAAAALIDGLHRRESRDGMETAPSVERRAVCARLLGEIKDRRGEAVLLASLGEEAREVRTAAAIALPRMGASAGSEDLMGALIDGLRSDDPTLADECGEALAAFRGAAVRALVDALGIEAERANAEGDHAPSRPLLAMARTLGRMGEPGLRALVSLARHASPLVRGVAVANLGRAHSALARSVIVRAVKDPDVRVRRTAIAMLESIRRPAGRR